MNTLSSSATIGSSSARPRQASHCGPDSDCVVSHPCRKSSSVASTTRITGTESTLTAVSSGAARPDSGSRRRTSPDRTEPRPMTTNAIVIDAVGRSAAGVSGPSTSGITEAMHRIAP